MLQHFSSKNEIECVISEWKILSRGTNRNSICPSHVYAYDASQAKDHQASVTATYVEGGLMPRRSQHCSKYLESSLMEMLTEALGPIRFQMFWTVDMRQGYKA